MEWQDKAVLLKTSLLKENSYIVTLLTENKGIKRGIINVSKKNHHLIQIGNILNIVWKARLEEHLGKIKIIDYYNIYPYIFENNIKLYMVLGLGKILSDLLGENEAHNYLFHKLLEFLYNINKKEYIYYYIQFELSLLGELGYGLDLSKCVVSGVNTDLTYISPRTGKAVSSREGEKYRNKLFKIPQSFKYFSENIADKLGSLKILRYFLEKNLYSLKNFKLTYYRVELEKIIAAKNDN